MSLTITLLCQVKSWLTASSPLPLLVGATIKRLPNSGRCLVFLTVTSRLLNKARLVPRSTPSGANDGDSNGQTSSRWANLARCSARPTTTSLVLHFAVGSVRFACGLDQAGAVALGLPRWRRCAYAGSPVPATALA